MLMKKQEEEEQLDDSDKTPPVYSYERIYSIGTLSQFEVKLIRKGAARSTVASEQDGLTLAKYYELLALFIYAAVFEE